MDRHTEVNSVRMNGFSEWAEMTEAVHHRRDCFWWTDHRLLSTLTVQVCQTMRGAGSVSNQARIIESTTSWDIRSLRSSYPSAMQGAARYLTALLVIIYIRPFYIDFMRISTVSFTVLARCNLTIYIARTQILGFSVDLVVVTGARFTFWQLYISFGPSRDQSNWPLKRSVIVEQIL